MSALTCNFCRIRLKFLTVLFHIVTWEELTIVWRVNISYDFSAPLGLLIDFVSCYNEIAIYSLTDMYIVWLFKFHFPFM